jgi:predicted RNase H-like HicB family nuclease
MFIQINKMFKYEIIIYWSDDDEAYIAEVPELPGCMTDGKTYDEVLENVTQLIKEWLETAKELGREIPKPKGHLIYAQHKIDVK